MDSTPLSSPLLLESAPPPPPLYRRVLFFLSATVCVLVALISYRYVVGFVPPNIAANSLRRPFLVLHVAGAATCLLLGPFQMVKAIRSRWPRVHRISGRVYAFACLVGGLAALPLAWGVSTGPVAALGFGLLAVTWLAVTANATRLAIERRIVEHREWMLRSFALTFAAVTLRLLIVTLPLLLGVTFDTGYVCASWASWLPNLLLVELYIRHTRSAVVGPVSESKV
jgi:hypothetical protein